MLGASAKRCVEACHGATKAASRTDDDVNADAEATFATKPASTRAVMHAMALMRWLMTELSVILGRACITAEGACVFWHSCITAVATLAHDISGAQQHASSRVEQCASSLAEKSFSQ